MSSTSQKHKDFVAEPMGEKEVQCLAGIGDVLGGKLVNKGFDKLLLIYSNEYAAPPLWEVEPHIHFCNERYHVTTQYRKNLQRRGSQGPRREQAYVVLGQFLVLRKDEELFKDWLRDTCGANSKQTRDCYTCLKEWCDAFFFYALASEEPKSGNTTFDDWSICLLFFSNHCYLSHHCKHSYYSRHLYSKLIYISHRRPSAASPVTADPALLRQSPPIQRCFASHLRSSAASPVTSDPALLRQSPPIQRCFASHLRSSAASPVTSDAALLRQSPPIQRCFASHLRSSAASPVTSDPALLRQSPPIQRCFASHLRSSAASPVTSDPALLRQSPPIQRCFASHSRSSAASPVTSDPALLRQSPPIQRCFASHLRSSVASPVTADPALLRQSPPIQRCFASHLRSSAASPVTSDPALLRQSLPIQRCFTSHRRIPSLSTPVTVDPPPLTWYLFHSPVPCPVAPAPPLHVAPRLLFQTRGLNDLPPQGSPRLFGIDGYR
ncbi:unnamed protein product [Ranitomeya imitator]|uniref:Uncharacterized protein n=1 Tax=Ranitomeya imitator TaxID=111125 RepID=A0ABN9L5V3_9NEOB|nr:unnamed protein product [Ranitomeya imitator]